MQNDEAPPVVVPEMMMTALSVAIRFQLGANAYAGAGSCGPGCHGPGVPSPPIAAYQVAVSAVPEVSAPPAAISQSPTTARYGLMTGAGSGGPALHAVTCPFCSVACQRVATALAFVPSVDPPAM